MHAKLGILNRLTSCQIKGQVAWVKILPQKMLLGVFSNFDINENSEFVLIFKEIHCLLHIQLPELLLK